jgi:hypothetical protein
MLNSIRPWEAFKLQIATPDRPQLGPAPRASRLSLAELNRKIDSFLAETTVPSTWQPAIRAAALLWHDYLDESHSLSQNIHTAEGSFLHGIMHRREPDYANAKYWFHRVGKHRCFPDIAGRVTRLVESQGEQELTSKFSPRGDWEPAAFVDACEAAASWPASDRRVQTLEAIQEIEFDCLLAHLFAG